ncbi:hypothetical protein DFJ58DRAFT_813602 [Suillus subalutaceus]|uniref:uncharacterized protein n=1 Tax=Suillus subalutaceus TaxID=48586 RepID=UPI001B86E2AC|nr:uncharacterized protein DFJ58DRAFT_813602 [Suillus subalutaceus]KAG1838650.1 hypothetical protein DFJ58DRAFT_813602 [Suillus subalutaceus]
MVQLLASVMSVLLPFRNTSVPQSSQKQAANLALTYPSSRNSGGKNLLTTNRTTIWRSPMAIRLHERRHLNVNQLNLQLGLFITHLFACPKYLPFVLI